MIGLYVLAFFVGVVCVAVMEYVHKHVIPAPDTQQPERDEKQSPQESYCVLTYVYEGFCHKCDVATGVQKLLTETWTYAVLSLPNKLIRLTVVGENIRAEEYSSSCALYTPCPPRCIPPELAPRQK